MRRNTAYRGCTARIRKKLDDRALNAASARDEFLNSLEVDEQAKVLRRAERDGPLVDDADWLLAYATSRAATRIEKAVVKVEEAAERSVQASSRAKTRATGRELIAFASALAVFAIIAWGTTAIHALRTPSLLLYAIAFALGVGIAASYFSITNRRR